MKKKKKSWKNLPLPLKHSNPNPFFKQIDQHYNYKSINLKKKKKIVPISSFESLIKKKIAKYYRAQ